MKHSLAIALLAATAMSGAALAETTPSDVAKTKQELRETDAAIAKQKENIAVNRAEKDAAKANNNPLDQASQSVQIGANKTAIEANKLDKKVDQKILNHQEKKLEEKNAPASR
ncbi:MAG: hypothetical protein SFT92_09240 [Rickettsiales bacterium]|nr:hypothetical protein [Rickettsiales bacterium]